MTQVRRSVLTIAAVVVVLWLATTAHAQTCSSILKKSASIGGCDNVYFAWIYTGQSPVVSQRLTYGDGFSPPIDKTVRHYSRMGVGCGYSVSVTVTQTYANGQTCFVTEGDNHNRPCSQCGANGGGNQTTIVSAANFRPFVARNSVASIFPDPGTSFTDRSETAFSLPLPTTLAGVTVEINGQLCPLFAVTPGQINFLLPEWLAEGPTEVMATIRTTRGSVGQFFGRPQLNPNAPGVFTLSSTGIGPAASMWLVIKPNGQQVYYAPGTLRFDLSDTVVLILYGTGINESVADLIMGNGQTIRAQYSGNSWMPGVQQLNFILSPNQIWSGTVGAFVRVHRAGVGWWDSQGFDLRR